MFKLPPHAQKVIDLYESFDWQQVVQIPVTKTSAETNRINIFNQEVISFGNSSYLGLHKDQRVIEAGVEAIRKFGVVYSSSRSFTYNSIHDEFEELLTNIFGSPTLAAIQTTMADLGAMPVLMLPEDVVLIDYMAHATLQNVVLIPKANGTTVDRIKHNDLSHLETKIKYYSTKTKEKIWYVCDSVYSMYGDTAPINELIELMNKYPNFYLYIDDAHGMSWTGPNGAGYASKFLPFGHPKVIIATSLGKGFGIGGGALVCPNKEVKSWIKRVGLNNVFCTQLPNQMLGSGIEVAKIHLSDEIYYLQDKISENINYFTESCRKNEIPLQTYNETPIFFLPLGDHEIAVSFNSKLRSKGFYANIGTFPAVPYKNCGLRVSITSDHKIEEIDSFMSAYKDTLKEVLEKNQISIESFSNSFESLSNSITI